MRSYAQQEEKEMPMDGPRVRFSETSEMVLVTKLSEGPDKHNIWFTQDELDLFKANMATYIRMVRAHIAKRHAPTASNILGMEKFLTIQLTEEYKFRRGKLMNAVMKEARWQRMLAARGRLDEKKSLDLLAKITAENSMWARERARAAALFLEQDQETEMGLELKKQTMNNQQCASRLGSFTSNCRRRAPLQSKKRQRFNMSPSPLMANDSSEHFARTVSPPRSSREEHNDQLARVEMTHL